MSVGIETAAGEMDVAKMPRSTATYLALMSAGVEMPAGGMDVSKTPHSRGSGERWDRDGGWRDGYREEGVQKGLW